jgi:transglutaminase-like putative cysteine protease
MHRHRNRCAAPAALVLIAFAGCSSVSVDPKVAALTEDSGSFRVEHTLAVPVPEGARRVELWLPLPRVEAAQDTTELKVEAPAGWQETTDALGNRYVHVRADAPTGKVTVRTSFVLTRREVNVPVDPTKTRPLTDAERASMSADLAPNRHIVLNDEIRTLAASIRGDETNPVLVARKLYDWTLDNVEYWVKDPAKWKASPVGSSEYCLAQRTGNCTDFHSLWTALARASGIPTRLVYGSLFKPSLDGQDRDASYHCWPEFFAPGIGWIPHDVAIADIFVAPIALDASNTERVTLTTANGYEGPSKDWVDYYFGNLDARRVTWTMGRDLTLAPPQQAGPVNANAKGYVEIDGKEFAGFERKMTFRATK